MFVKTELIGLPNMLLWPEKLEAVDDGRGLK